MSTLTKFMIVSGVDNHPPMLDKPQMSLGKVVWNSTFKNGTVRPKTYEELSDKEKLQADYDLKATNIPKRRRDATWFKEKVLLVQVHAEGKDLDEEQLAFLADSGVAAKAVLMANLSSCDSNVLFEVPYSDTSQNNMMNQSVHEFQYSELLPIFDYLNIKITSYSNIIPYSQYLEETQQPIVQNTNTSTQQNSMLLSMFEQMSNHATNWNKDNNESKIVDESLTAKLERYKERVKILEQRFNVDLSGREKVY
ncbi:hypothetical protein Tco_1199038 [Tanacetum coccineum]